MPNAAEYMPANSQIVADMDAHRVAVIALSPFVNHLTWRVDVWAATLAY